MGSAARTLVPVAGNESGVRSSRERRAAAQRARRERARAAAAPRPTPATKALTALLDDFYDGFLWARRRVNPAYRLPLSFVQHWTASREYPRAKSNLLRRWADAARRHGPDQTSP